SPITKRKFELSQYIGGIERDATARIVKAKAMLMFYGIKFNPVLNKVEGRLVSIPTLLYEKDRGDSVQGDIQLLFIGYILIIAYVAVMLGKFTRLNIKAWLALLGVLCIGLAIGVSFGLSSAFGASYGPVHPLLPFLLLSIGVDDMFVVVQAWNNLPPDLIEQRGVPEAIGLTLKHAGVSITITSLTDLLAFMIGASSILPALRSFCIFAGIGILADFAIQTTLFTAFLALDARRREKRRDGCCCCFRLSDGYSESDCGKRDLLQKLMDKYFGRALLTLPGKITVMIVTGVLVGFNLYGAIMLRQYFDQVWFLPPNSMGYKYTVTSSKFFPLDGAPLTIYTGNFDYFGNQEKLHLLHDVVVKDESVIASSLNSWYEEYINWASKNQPGQYFNKSSTQWRINNRNKFHEWLLDFLKGPGISYRKDVWFTNVSGQLPKIKAARFNVRHKDMDSTQTEVKAMDDLRGKIEKVFPDDLAFPYSPFYLGWETNKVILEELFRNMAFNLMVVFVVTLVVLANLRACLMVFTCVGFTLVSITGTMHFWGVTIETVSTILLLIAVGLSVDYASHVAHTFMIISGTRYDRARATLRDIGPAVWNGGFSTFLAIALLAFSESYPSKTFFKVS
ncbi:unnamed protein product, partial [Porites evermanni]